MMMPANFSAIAESEMTYVVGGGLIDALGAVTAPIWNADNVKTFNTNLVTIVGNSYVSKVIGGTLGTIFKGDYLVKVGEGDDAKRNTVFGKNKGLWNALDPNGDAETNGFNKFLQGVGALAAVYTLGTSKTKSFVAENVIGVKDGAAKTL
ncbi:MAG: hypothetical protein EGQ64_06160 [Ruminococcaceae bacterium]|nr:hypothetical protein [Oscillospiraceae bacterium]